MHAALAAAATLVALGFDGATFERFWIGAVSIGAVPIGAGHPRAPGGARTHPK